VSKIDFCTVSGLRRQVLALKKVDDPALARKAADTLFSLARHASGEPRRSTLSGEPDRILTKATSGDKPPDPT
jgi:hypothetical protein